MARQIVGPPFIYNPVTEQWEQVGGTDIHRVQRSVEQPVDPNVEIWIRLLTKDDGTTYDVIMLKNGSGNWYAPNDTNLDGVPDRAAVAGNAEKLGDYSPSHYATTESVNNIVSGSTVVGKANKDGSGNNIVSTYATKAALETTNTNLTTTNSNIDKIVDGTTKVAKATAADKATQLANARTINGTSFNGTSNITIPIVTSGTSAPSNTKLLWLDTNYTPNLLKFYNGSAWQALNTYQ